MKHTIQLLLSPGCSESILYTCTKTVSPFLANPFTMYPRVILRGTMIKKAQQKRRTSPCNYKERFFVLDTQDLKYSERRPGKKPSLKGCIQLSSIRCVEIVCTKLHIPCNNKYPFQVFHDNLYLYIFAQDNDCRQRWVRALKEETKHNDLVVKFHPNFWMDGRWQCCHQTEKLATGCKEYSPEHYGLRLLPEVPESEIPDRTGILHAPGERVVVALQDYTPDRDTELSLQKDQEYILLDSSCSDWWAIQDNRGNKGYVPCTYVAEMSSANFDRFEWYNKDITRGQAEELLMREGKEGAFMIRDSRRAGAHIVSVFTKAPGSNGEKNPQVKHYQIREAETERETSQFYLAEKYLFDTIPELINYHQYNAAGLITRLRKPVSQNRSFSKNPSILNEDHWELDPEELLMGHELGSGQFGLVLEAKWRDRKVAVKTVKEGAMSEDEFKEEARTLMKLSHCKLVRLFGVCTERSPMCLVFEFMENGCLSDHLQVRKGHLSPVAMLGMCLDVSEGMAYLESSHLIHRDLAARNCLVSKNNEVKVGDFGMARFVLDDQYTCSMGSKFSIKWSAPEVIKYSKFSSKSDIWSFGVLMWEIYSEGRMPYEHSTNAEVVDSLYTGLRLVKPRLAPDAIYLLMEWCWKERTEDRPSFAQLLHELASLSNR